MSTTSDVQTNSIPATQNSMSEAEKLRRRRAARNKRILASGTDRLNRIVGLSSSRVESTSEDKPKPETSNLDSFEEPIENSPKINDDISKTSEPSFLPSPTVKDDIKSSSSSSIVIEPQPTPSPSITPTEDIVPKTSVNDKSQSTSNPKKETFEDQSQTTFKSTNAKASTPTSQPNNSELNNAILRELLKSSDSGGAFSNMPLSDITNPTDVNELMANILPSFLAQHASEAVLASPPNQFHSEAPRSTTSPTSASGWSLDSGLGKFFRIFFLVAMVLVLLFWSSPSSSPVTARSAAFEEPGQDGTILNLPYVGNIKPIHILLAVEVVLQTHRYFNARNTPPQRLSSTSNGLPGALGQMYQLYTYYSASWNSLVDDLCFGVFFLGLGTLFSFVMHSYL